VFGLVDVGERGIEPAEDAERPPDEDDDADDGEAAVAGGVQRGVDEHVHRLG
jgi:hypothetical protein